MFLMLDYIKWPNFITWLFLLLEILGYMCLVIICCPAYDVINFEINPSFFVKLFFSIIKKSGQKLKYLKYEMKAFNMK